MEFEEAKKFRPGIAFVDSRNKLVKGKKQR
jgi:aspartate 1-decarboxylase